MRPYEARDREAVRAICCDTADGGGPVEAFFPDREVFADLLTRYYTDFEPESLWVAESHGRVQGYVSGCLSTRRFHRVLVGRIVWRVLGKAIVRGTLWRREVMRLAWLNLPLGLRWSWGRGVDLGRYPSHLHVNLAAGLRGQGVGRRLIAEFCRRAARLASPGVHAHVSEGSPRAMAFFEGEGFLRAGRSPLMRFAGDPGRTVYSVTYAKAL